MLVWDGWLAALHGDPFSKEGVTCMQDETSKQQRGMGYNEYDDVRSSSMSFVEGGVEGVGGDKGTAAILQQLRQ